MNIAVIPARGGSKRIPQKNIKNFCGKPLIAYSIETARRSEIFDEIIVSTDDKQIASVAKKYGAKVPFVRPKEISDDFSNTLDVMQHSAIWLNNEYQSISTICCIYATAPFLNENDLVDGFKRFQTNIWSYVFSATTFPFPIQRALKKIDSGGVEAVQPKYISSRSQDLEEYLHDAGQFYFGRAKSWINKEKIFQVKSDVVILPQWKVQDIDNIEDWKNSEIKFKTIHNANFI